MSRSRPTKLEKYLERRVQITFEGMEYTRKKLETAERGAKTPDDPDVLRERHNLAEARKRWQDAVDDPRRAL